MKFKCQIFGVQNTLWPQPNYWGFMALCPPPLSRPMFLFEAAEVKRVRWQVHLALAEVCVLSSHCSLVTNNVRCIENSYMLAYTFDFY